MLGRKKKISPFLSDHRDSELEQVPSRRPVALNPLAMFPSRRDPLANGLFSQSLSVPAPMLSRAVEDERWLESGKIDPEFGLIQVRIANIYICPDIMFQRVIWLSYRGIRKSWH